MDYDMNLIFLISDLVVVLVEDMFWEDRGHYDLILLNI